MDLELIETRAVLYGFLSNLLSAEPKKELIKELSTIAPALSGLQLPDSPLMTEGFDLLSRMFKEELSKDKLDEIKWDYTRLFIGPYKLPAPPYESVYTSSERLVMQESTIDVRRKYAKLGLQIKNIHRQPDDSVGIELQFMQLNCRKTIEAMEENRMDAANFHLEMQKEFLEEHLSRWIPRFCDDVIASSGTDLYRGVAKILKGFIEVEEGLFKELSLS